MNKKMIHPEAAISPERLDFLKGRLDEAARRQPAILTLQDLLLELGGVTLVAPLGIDPDIDAVVAHGRRFDASTARSVPGRDSECHGNVSRLWIQRRGRMSIVTGYALSEDGLWRSHTWGVEDERVVETTEPRILYYGVVLPAQVARKFAAANAQ